MLIFAKARQSPTGYHDDEQLYRNPRRKHLHRPAKIPDLKGRRAR